MTYFPTSIDFYIDVFCLGWLFAFGFRCFDYCVWCVKFIGSTIADILSRIKSRHPKD